MRTSHSSHGEALFEFGSVLPMRSMVRPIALLSEKFAKIPHGSSKSRRKEKALVRKSGKRSDSPERLGTTNEQGFETRMDLQQFEMQMPDFYEHEREHRARGSEVRLRLGDEEGIFEPTTQED